MKNLIIITILISLTSTVNAIEFTTKHNSAGERATIEVLTALRKSHDLTRWEFTDKVIINEESIPHSHPLLTLHTRHTKIGHTDLLLSTYLHEQIHWHISKNDEKTKSLIEELKSIFQNVPTNFPIGSGDEYGTYLHLIVCYLEIEAISQLLSKKRVNDVIKYWQNDHYTWVYKQVENESEVIQKLIIKHGLNII